MRKNKNSNDMKDKIREILVKYNDNKIANDKAEAELLNLFSVSGSSTLKDERWRIWIELCKGETDGAFASTLELEADDIHEMIFKGKEIKL
jgi:hypothetical protein